MVSPFPLNLSAEIVSTPPSFLKLKALIDPLHKEVESKVELTHLEITRFAPYLPDLPFTLLKGYCALNLKMTANSSLDLYSQGLLSFKDITLSPVSTSAGEPSDTFIDTLRNITIDLDHRLSYKSAEDIIKLEKLNTTIQKVKLSLEGKISLSNHEIIIDHLKTTFQDSPLILKGRIDNYLKGPLTAKIHLNSPSLILDDLIYCLEKDKDKRETKQEEEKEQERREIGPFNFNHAKIKADISLESVIYKNMHISDLKATCLFQDNVLNLEPLEGRLTDGSIHLKSRINLGVRGLDYTLKLIGNNLQLNPIVTSFAPDLQENIYGIMDLTLDLRGRGTTSDAYKKNLKGEGKIHIEEGKVSDLKSLQALASFIKVDKLSTLNFDQSQGTFQIKDGLVHSKSSLKGKEIEIYPEGTISFDSYLNLSLEMRLSPHISEQIANEALTKYFKDERGWTVIALAIKPAPSTIQHISEMIADIIFKKEELDSDKRQDKKKALENLLKELIQKSKENKKAQ